MSRARVLGLVLAVFLCGGFASGQVVEKPDLSQETPDQIIEAKLERMIKRVRERIGGQVVRVHYSFRGYSGTLGGGMKTWYSKGVIVVDGSEELPPEPAPLPELEEIPEEGDADEVIEYRMIDYARDLLAGKFSEQLVEVADTDRERRGVKLPRMSWAEIVEEAVGAYEMHLTEHPEDWFAMREMGAALLELGRVEDAIDLNLDAYEQNPELGIFPISGELFGKYSKTTIEKLVVRAVQHVNRRPSGEGWLLVGALMQAQGRFELAGKMIDRAEGLGLDQSVVDGFRESLP